MGFLTTADPSTDSITRLEELYAVSSGTLFVTPVAWQHKVGTVLAHASPDRLQAQRCTCPAAHGSGRWARPEPSCRIP